MVQISVGTAAVPNENFSGFPQSFQDRTSTGPLLLPSKSIPVYYSTVYQSALSGQERLADIIRKKPQIYICVHIQME
jgi:hypothetical protein